MENFMKKKLSVLIYTYLFICFIGILSVACKTDNDSEEIKSSETIKTCKITFNSNDGSILSRTETQIFMSGTSQALKSISKLGFSKDGYSFVGWALTPNATKSAYSDGGAYTATSDITLYAVWARNQFTITFNSNDGNSTPITSKQKFDFGVSQALKSISLLGFSRDGYTFIGWAVSPYSNTPIYSDGESYKASSDITLYAVLEKKQFTITFNLNDDSESCLIVTQTFTYGSSQPLETIASLGFSRDSYSFVGWALTSNATKATYSDGELYTATSDITLYAIWIKQFKITFDSNDGSSVSKTSTQTFTSGISQSLETIASLGFTKDGYSFIGWATIPNSTTAKYSDGMTYTATSDITLYAVWAKQFTVTFDENNGSSVPKTGSQIFISGISQPLKNVSLLGFSKENCVFTGWSRNKNETVSSYNDGADFIADGDITLYATWFSYNSEDSNFSITKDDFTGTTFIEHNYFSSTRSKEPMEFYISRVSSGDYYLVVRFYYIGSDWIFFKKAILIDSKGNKFQRTFDYSKITHKIQGSIVTERIDLPLSKGESLMDDIEKVFQDDNIRLRLTGKYYEDYDLEVERVKALKEVLWLYNKLEISNYCE